MPGRTSTKRVGSVKTPISDGFALECRAIKHVRERMGLANVQVMVPFVRTVEELKLVLREMEANGLVRGAPNNQPLRVIMMCEVPSNAILASEFLQLVDGFSIGSNDLTQLTLGIDRNAEHIARLYDEQNDAVKSLIGAAIKAAKEQRKYVGICGEAPSDHPEFCQFLVEAGIESISVQPSRCVPTRFIVSDVEEGRQKKEA